MWSFLGKIIGTPMGWIYNVVEDYGLAIILFTILLKIVLFPMSLKQHKSSLAMIRLKPYQDELMKKYGSNRQKYSEELQKLYQREGYNPMSSCFPMLIQMPLLFMVYAVVRRPLTYMGAGWVGDFAGGLWGKITSFLAPEQLGKVWNERTLEGIVDKVTITAENYNKYETQLLSALDAKGIEVVDTTFLGLNLTLTPSHVWKTSAFLIILIPILSGVTSFLMSWLSQKLSPAQRAAEGQPGGNMKMMLYVMPIMSFFIAFTFSAGLGVYWIISNVMGIAQQLLLHVMYNPDKIEQEVRDKMAAEKQKEKEKRAAAAAKKAQFTQGKKKKKKTNAPNKANGEKTYD